MIILSELMSMEGCLNFVKMQRIVFVIFVLPNKVINNNNNINIYNKIIIIMAIPSVRLGMAICVPHNCHCWSLVDAHGLHSFVCRKAPGKISRHHALNDLVARAFTSAGIPSSKEPHGLVRSDGKRPDGLKTGPLEGRQTSGLGRHGRMYCG